MEEQLYNLNMLTIKRKVTTLFKISLRCISKHAYKYDSDHLGEILPVSIKTAILNKIISMGRGFDDDNLLKALMSEKTTSLSLTNSTVTDKTLELCVEKCTNLTELKMNGANYKFTKEGLLENIPKLQRLKILVLPNCYDVCDELLVLIGQNCVQLEYLDVGGCKCLTDKSVDGIKNLKLTTLSLAKTNITDISLRLIGTEDCGKQLTDLNISYCNNISGAGLACLRWDIIEYIGFQGCNAQNLEFIISNGKMKFCQWTI